MHQVKILYDADVILEEFFLCRVFLKSQNVYNEFQPQIF